MESTQNKLWRKGVDSAPEVGTFLKEDSPINAIPAGYVRVKVFAAPINPSDRMYAVNFYGVQEKIKKGDSGIGFEGSG